MQKKGLWALALVGVIVIAVVVLNTEQQTAAPQSSEHSQSIAAPSISYQDILRNPELVQKSKQAVEQGDDALLRDLQQKAVEIAHAAQLPEEQVALLEGQRGRDYMRFLAQRQLFVDGFETRFKNLQSITTLKLAYPQAQDLFEQADRLIEQRDETITAIAKVLADGLPHEEFLPAARQEWKARASQAPNRLIETDTQ